MTETSRTGRRAEDVQPSEFNAHRITEPPTRRASAEMRAAIERQVEIDDRAQVVRLQLGDVATDLTLLRMQADAKELTGKRLDQTLASAALRLRSIVAGLAVAALVVVALVAGPSAGRAEAMEAPRPDPVAHVLAPAAMSVTLASASVTTRVRVTTPHVTPRGYHCASAWTPTSFLGRACSRYASFAVPVTLDRFAPLGRSTVTITDDVAPMNTTPARVALDVRRPSRFGVGTWAPTFYGDGLTVTAPLYAYTPALGAWTPQLSSPVRVEELIGARWVLRATLTTDRHGIARGSVTIGGGLHTVRVVRQRGATVETTNGTARTFYLVPSDVPVDIV